MKFINNFSSAIPPKTLMEGQRIKGMYSLEIADGGGFSISILP